ncbi:MAG: protein kinase [Planctomycetota bacterium]|nr:protein kinase [Planctomycetota bacterium]
MMPPEKPLPITVHEDLFLRIALRKGLMPSEFLTTGLEDAYEQDGRHIGLVLLRQRLLDTEDLRTVCREIQKFLSSKEYADRLHAEEEQVAKQIARRQLIPERRLQEVRGEQESLQEKGQPYSLGFLLMEKGDLDPIEYLEFFKDTLVEEYQSGVIPTTSPQKQIVSCSECSARFRVKKSTERKGFRCSRCGNTVRINRGQKDTKGSGILTGKTTRQTRPTKHRKRKEARSSAFDKENFAGYQILGEIARGGMGIVYKASQKNLNRIVALKILKEGDRATKASIERFMREARAAGKLRHPNIIAVYEVDRFQGVPYFSMEYIEGDSLDTLISKKRLGVQKSLGLLIDVAKAVHHAHSEGVIHRDLKPGNILVDADGAAKITDFGLAKNTEVKGRLTRSGFAIGTPYYMSPEQARGDLKRIGARSDVYNLGVILYECLTGRVPFTGRSNVEIYEKIRHEEPRPPREHQPSVPRDIQTICLRTIEKDPSARYPTALDFAEDIERFLAGEPIQARPVPIQARIFKKIVKHKLVSSLVLLLALVVIGSGMAIYYFQWKTEEERADRQQGSLVDQQRKKREVERLLRSGQEAMEEYQIESALRFFQQAYDLLPNHPATLIERGIAYYYQGDHLSAVADLEIAAQKAPGRVRAHFFLGTAYSRLGQYDRSLGKFNRAIDLSPKDARIYYYRGQSMLAVGEDRKAFKDCKKALELDKNYYLALCSRGLLYLLHDSHEKALQSFQKASALRPRDPRAHLLIGMTHLQARRPRQAIIHLHQMSKIETDYSEPLPPHYREKTDGGLLYKAARLSQLEPMLSPDEFLVESNFWKTFGMNPQSVSAKNLIQSIQVALGNLIYKTYAGQYELAMSNLSLVLYFVKPLTQFLLHMSEEGTSYMEEFHNLTDLEVYYLSRCLIHLKKYELAGSTIDRYLRETTTDSAMLHVARGLAHESIRGREDLALDQFNKAIRKDPAIARAYVLRGRTYMNSRQQTRARSDFLKALEIDPLRYEAAYYLGRMAQEKGDTEGQRKWWKQATELCPDLIRLRSRLSRIKPLPNTEKNQ